MASHWDLLVQEISCAVSFAAAHTAEYGGDPDHITLYGLSAGGNAVLMGGLAGVEPLDTCAAPGPVVTPDALVPIDADWVLGGGWDTQLSDDPEAFYSITPWRYLDGSQNLQIYVMVTEDHTLVRNVDPDAATSWLSYRHPDIDLQADLKAMCCSGAVGEMCEMAQHCVIWCALLGVSTSRVTGRRITRQLDWAGVPNTPGGLSSVAPAHGDWEALVARPGREPSQRSPP